MDESQPLPRTGGYSINWDEIDENTNPFESKSKLTNPDLNQMAASYDLNQDPINQDLPEIEPATPVQKNNNFILDGAIADVSIESLSNNITAVASPRDLNISYDLRSSQVKLPSSAFEIDSPAHNSEAVNGYKNSNLINLEEKKRIEELEFCLLEYQRSLQYMIDQKERVDTKSNDPIAQIISERDQALKELTTLERAFTELHGRFDRAKMIIENYKENEKKLQESLQKMNEWLQRREEKYNALKKSCEEEVTKIVEKCQQQKQKHESEIAVLQANVRMSELKIKNLESDLENQKQTTNELTTICDDLLSRYNPEEESK